MFDIKNFLKENIIASVKGGYMAESSANLTAFNYMEKGYFVEQDIIDIQKAIKPTPISTIEEQEGIKEEIK